MLIDILCVNVSMEAIPFADMISVTLLYQSFSLQNKVSYLLLFIKTLKHLAYLIFCSDESHFGHRVNYYVSKLSAERI